MLLDVDRPLEQLPQNSPIGVRQLADVAAFQQSAMAVNTGLAYRSDWQQFQRWCRLHATTSLPAEPLTVAAYLADQANRQETDGGWTFAPATLSRRLAGITKAHEVAGLLSPCRDPRVASTMSGIRRQRQTPPRRAAPLMLAELRQILGNIELKRAPEAVIGRRDAALLVMGFAGAFRRSELVALTVEDITLNRVDGLHVRMRHSKTDQEGRGSIKALPFGVHPDTCPPCVYLRWRQVLDAFETGGRVRVMRVLRAAPDGELAHICRDDPAPDPGLAGDRPVFRPVHKNASPGSGALSGQAIPAVVKRRAAAAGMDTTNLSGHSLRAGFVTQAVRGGADAGSIMRQTGHRSHAMVELYRRENAPLIGNAVTTLGL